MKLEWIGKCCREILRVMASECWMEGREYAVKKKRFSNRIKLLAGFAGAQRPVLLVRYKIVKVASFLVVRMIPRVRV